MHMAAAGQAGAVPRRDRGELAVADDGVDQDDVLAVDQAGGAGAGHRLPGQVSELAVRCDGAACGDDREDPAGVAPAGRPRTAPGPVVAAGLRAAGAAAGAVAADDGQGGLAGVGSRRPAAGRAAGPQRANGRAAGSRRARSPAIARPSRTEAGIRPRTGRPATAAASITAAEPSGVATRSPGRENAVMTGGGLNLTGPGQGPYEPLRGRAGPARYSAAHRDLSGRPRGRRARCRARLRPPAAPWA